MAVPNSPVVNGGILYVNDLQLANLAIPSTPVSSYVAGKALVLQPGQARCSQNLNDIHLPQAQVAGAPYVLNGLPVGAVINGLQVGANGCDTAVLAANSMYAVYVIASSLNVNSTTNQLGGGPSPNPLGPIPLPNPVNPYPAAGLLSLRYPNGPVVVGGVVQDKPILPFGYDMYRRVGWASTDAGALLQNFWQYGCDEDRWYYLDNAVLVVAAAAAGPTAVPLAVGVGGSANLPAVPPLATQVSLDVVLSVAGTARFFPFGSSSAAGIVRFSAGAGAEPGNVTVPENLNAGVPTVNVAVSAGTAQLSVIGYQDCL